MRTEAEALHAASSGLARLDERMRLDPLAPTLASWYRTVEAIGIAASEGLMVQEIDLLRMLDGADDPVGSRAHRTALDVHAALSASVGWRADEVDAAAMAEAFRLSERSNTRRSEENAEGRLDIDASILAERLSLVSTHDPWTAAEMVRHAWTAGGFSGRSRRMALLAAPSLLAHGFGCQVARCVPLAAQLTREGPLAAVDDPEAWPAHFFSAVAAGAARAREALSAMGREVEHSNRVLEQRKSNSRNGPAAQAFMGRPVRSVTGLADAIGVTTVGAAQILERLTRNGLVALASADGRGKGRQFVWRKAVGL